MHRGWNHRGHCGSLQGAYGQIRDSFGGDRFSGAGKSEDRICASGGKPSFFERASGRQGCQRASGAGFFGQ